jgi:putative transposase
MVPANFAPHTTVYRWFLRLRDEGVFETINHQLLILDRERVGRNASPSAAVLDSQSVRPPRLAARDAMTPAKREARSKRAVPRGSASDDFRHIAAIAKTR